MKKFILFGGPPGGTRRAAPRPAAIVNAFFERRDTFCRCRARARGIREWGFSRTSVHHVALTRRQRRSSTKDVDENAAKRARAQQVADVKPSSSLFSNSDLFTTGATTAVAPSSEVGARVLFLYTQNRAPDAPLTNGDTPKPLNGKHIFHHEALDVPLSLLEAAKGALRNPRNSPRSFQSF